MKPNLILFMKSKNKKYIIFCGVLFTNINVVYEKYKDDGYKKEYIYLLNNNKFSLINCIFRFQPNDFRRFLLQSPLYIFFGMSLHFVKHDHKITKNH